MEDGRGDVIGKIAVDADTAARSEGCEVGLENVMRHNVELGELSCKRSKAARERGIQFYGAYRTASHKKMTRHFAMPSPNFNPAVIVVFGQRDGGMRRDANGAGDLFAPVEVRKKMLAEPLARHGRISVTGAGVQVF